jgi:hypothetical protein
LDEEHAFWLITVIVEVPSPLVELARVVARVLVLG